MRARAGDWLIAEGPHLYAEALACGVKVRAVVATEAPAELPAGARLLLVTPRVFASLSETESPQGILALVRAPRHELKDGPVLVLDGLQDPGNAGTLVRAAEAFGGGGVLFLKGAVSPWNGKVLRASAGSAFRVPIVVTSQMPRLDRTLFAASPDAGEDPARVDLSGSIAIAIGGEGAGLSKELKAAARPLRIPTEGVESLNAAVAGAILLYEAARQRRQR